MFHLENTINRIKSMISERERTKFLKKYPIQDLLPHSFFDDLDSMSLVEFSVHLAVYKNLPLLPNRIASLIENEDLHSIFIDEFKRYLTLNTWAANNSQSVPEQDISPYVTKLMDILSDKETEELKILEKTNEVNNAIKNNGDSATNLQRDITPDDVIAKLTVNISIIPNYSLPVKSFIAVYQKVHNNLKNSKGTQRQVEKYKSYNFNQIPERRLHNRYWRYFESTLKDLSEPVTSINLVLFEREYNLVLASHINSVTENLSDSCKEQTRKVLSLAALFPNVEGRLLFIEDYKKHQELALNGVFRPLSIAYTLDDFYDSLFNLASDMISMSLFILPIMEVCFQDILRQEDVPHLEKLAAKDSIHLYLKDQNDIEETLLNINRVQSICSKNRLSDIEFLLDKFSKDHPNENSGIDSKKIERLGDYIRDNFYKDYLKFDK